VAQPAKCGQCVVLQSHPEYTEVDITGLHSDTQHAFAQDAAAGDCVLSCCPECRTTFSAFRIVLRFGCTEAFLDGVWSYLYYENKTKRCPTFTAVSDC